MRKANYLLLLDFHTRNNFKDLVMYNLLVNVVKTLQIFMAKL